MTPTPAWWESEHADAAPPFSDELVQLLADVEDAFTRTGAHTPGWEDPHLGADGELRDSREEEYSRCLDPGKYRILWTRAEAWAQVLTARGWAEAEEDAHPEWVTAPQVATHRTTVLRPSRPGAEPLLLARTAPEDAGGSTDLEGADAQILGLVIGAGDPAVPVSTVPDCGCDACDSGSHDLLEDLDRTLLSIVDGSFEAELAPGWSSQRTSFGAQSGSGDEDANVTMTLTAGPWADGWEPRPLSPALHPQDSAWTEEVLRESWFQRLPLLPSRPAVSTAYFALEQSEPTAPLDALEHPPVGYRRDHRSTQVTGMDFETAASALRSWAVHRRAGLQVSASHTPLQEGTEVHLHLGRRPLRLTIPCRVTRVIDEPDRAGFGYITLPGHPESGIEQFTVTRTATGLVRFHLDVVSRPAAWYARLGAPLARLVQELFTRRYLRALSTPAA